MAHPIRIRPQVEAEISEAMAWYGDRVPGLDGAFLRALTVALVRVSEVPESYATIRGAVRRAILRKFPYAVYYVFDGVEVIVLACIHERRSPERWPAAP
ncbi:MAG: type II toxin-antitoxin system RelE/ParE family toxin [Gemmatimonadetes bacterium]|nr:type II toxin-antitoxin system RelE/ParE family toxin [Gemmatimonadota bacterium]